MELKQTTNDPQRATVLTTPLTRTESLQPTAENNKIEELGDGLRTENLQPTTENNETDELGEELLPGIPNAITLDVITPKLPWLTVHGLSAVSTVWRHAIQSRRVYDARIRSNSTQSLPWLIRYTYIGSKKPTISLRIDGVDGDTASLPTSRSIRRLPKIPECEIMFSCCYWDAIPLDGKLYVLAADMSEGNVGRARVFAFDVAGQRLWEECASMIDPVLFMESNEFGIKDGRIHVFRGALRPSFQYFRMGAFPLGRKCRCDMYDPKSNTWSSIEDDIGNWKSAHQRGLSLAI